MSDIRVGIVGMGFMGRTHLAAYAAARRDGYAVRVAAICDSDPKRLHAVQQSSGNLALGASAARDLSGVRIYREPYELFSDPTISLVSICTPTDSHIELAAAALLAGKHVLVEKPVAIRSGDIGRLIAEADRGNALCMPAMCMRFWPEWAWLHERITAGTFGAVRSAVFQRLGTLPDWSAFYADEARSGGALFDLHIHDADFVRWCFGDADVVAAAGSSWHVSSFYRFGRGPDHVLAEGGLDHARGFPFRMRYVVVFEEATADFDLLRDPPLSIARNGGWTAETCANLNGYDGEVRHFLDVITRREAAPRVTLADAEAVARILEAEQESLRSGKFVAVRSD